MTTGQGPKRLRCTFLGSLPPTWGISGYCLELCRALSELVDVEAVAFKRMYPSFLYPGGDYRDDPTFRLVERPGLAVRRKLTYYNPFSWLWEALRARGDILHAQWWSPPLAPVYLSILALFRLRRKPIVLTVHDVLPHEGGSFHVFVTRALCRLASAVVVHCEANREVLVRRLRIRPEKVVCIPHGPLEFFKEHTVPPGEARARLGLRPDDKVILNFGSVREYKGIDVLLRAFARVRERVPSARLVIAGKRWIPWAPCQKIIDESGIQDAVSLRLDYVPNDEVNVLFQAADLVVLPYKWFDAQSGAAMAAVPFAKPLIVSRVGGLPELVADPRQVVEPGDPEGLAAAISDCLSDPARLEAMRASSVELARKCSWSGIARQTVALYESLLSPPRRGSTESREETANRANCRES